MRTIYLQDNSSIKKFLCKMILHIFLKIFKKFYFSFLPIFFRKKKRHFMPLNFLLIFKVDYYIALRIVAQGASFPGFFFGFAVAAVGTFIQARRLRFV